MTERASPTGWDFSAIGWLLDEVKQAGGEIPRRYYRTDDALEAYETVRSSRAALGRKISWAFTWEKSHHDLTSEALQKNRPKIAKKIRDQGRRLSESLQEDPALTNILATKMGLSPFKNVVMGDFMDLLKALEQAAGDILMGSGNSTALLPLSVTAQELLIQRLAKAYNDSENGLDADPRQGVVRKGNESRELVAMQGPFVAFVRCAYALAKKPALNEAALCKALQRAEIIG